MYGIQDRWERAGCEIWTRDENLDRSILCTVLSELFFILNAHSLVLSLMQIMSNQVKVLPSLFYTCLCLKICIQIKNISKKIVMWEISWLEYTNPWETNQINDFIVTLWHGASILFLSVMKDLEIIIN